MLQSTFQVRRYKTTTSFESLAFPGLVSKLTCLNSQCSFAETDVIMRNHTTQNVNMKALLNSSVVEIQYG